MKITSITRLANNACSLGITMLIRPTYSILISAPRLWLCWLFVAMTTLGSDEKNSSDIILA